MKSAMKRLGLGAALVLATAMLAPAARADGWAVSAGYSKGHYHRHGRPYVHCWYRGGWYRPCWSGSVVYYWTPGYYYLPPPPPPPPVVYEYRTPVYYYSGGTFYRY